jgi:hypothetical protein
MKEGRNEGFSLKREDSCTVMKSMYKIRSSQFFTPCFSSWSCAADNNLLLQD